MCVLYVCVCVCLYMYIVLCIYMYVCVCVCAGMHTVHTYSILVFDPIPVYLNCYTIGIQVYLASTVPCIYCNVLD